MDDGDSAEDRKRDALSPSPEVDLSSPDFDEDAPGAEDDFNAPPTPAGSSFSGRSSLTRDGMSGADAVNLVHNHRAASPPLEGDEKEFTQTASSMRMRGMSFEEAIIRQTTETENLAIEDTEMSVEETEEEKAARNRETAETLFGRHHESSEELGLVMMSSPLVKPMQTHLLVEKNPKRERTADLELKGPISVLGDISFGAGWDVRDPESIELEELDDWFGEY